MAELKHAFLSNVPVLIAGAVAIIAAGAWIMFLIWADDDAVQATKPVAAKAGTTDGSPPMRALPPPGTDLLPPVRTPPSEPLTSQQAAAPSVAAAETPVKPAKVAPGLPVTAAAPAETAQPTPSVQTAKRAERAIAEAAGISSGRYVGNISGGEAAGLTLVISSIDGGVVKGTASVTGGGVCDDNYSMQGSMRGGRLELRATRMGGRAGDCPLSLSLALAGDRLTGATGSGASVQLSKR